MNFWASASRWAARLSQMTMSPGRSVGPSTWRTYSRKTSESVAPSITRQLVTPSSRIEPSMVTVCQWLPGVWSCSLWPPRTRPRSRVMLVLAEDSSMKTIRPADQRFWNSFQRFLFSTMSARSCSLARSVFFIAVAEPPQRVVDGHRCAGGPDLLMNLLQGGVGVLVHIVLDAVQLLRPQAAWLTHLALARANAAASP